ncbi:MAG: ABC transporter ATP-binding protein [Hadesarchaea archaeon]|nr:ABC transporter ATP-binding protein [Hadesarchaea archaeon]
MVSLTLEHVTKRFGEVIAVDDVSLKIKDKELVVLVGPSGCGKSTTIRLIAGLETPDEGDIYFDDQLVTHLPPKNRQAAMVFQEYALYPHMTVFDNMAFGLRNFGYPENEVRKRVRRAAELLGIEFALKRRPIQLSGGQRQRVALGRAIVRDPKVYLWDEPLSNLDAKLRDEMRGELRKLQRRLGVTTIHVTHDQVEAMTMADRVAVMKDGAIRQFGTPHEVFAHPADEFVAGFIGSPAINIFECSLVEDNGRLALDAGDFIFKLPRGMRKALLKGASSTELKIGVRPEDIHTLTGRNLNPIYAKVDLVEPLGSYTLLHLAIGGKIAIMRVHPRMRIAPGEEIKIFFDPEKIHIFDKTAKAIV